VDGNSQERFEIKIETTGSVEVPIEEDTEEPEAETSFPVAEDDEDDEEELTTNEPLPPPFKPAPTDLPALEPTSKPVIVPGPTPEPIVDGDTPQQETEIGVNSTRAPWTFAPEPESGSYRQSLSTLTIASSMMAYFIVSILMG
jgi:hypothetical protein